MVAVQGNSVEIREKKRNSILLALTKMGDGQEQSLDKNHPGYDDFIFVVKQIIDEGKDWNNGFSITFNNAYTKLRKDDRFNFNFTK